MRKIHYSLKVCCYFLLFTISSQLIFSQSTKANKESDKNTPLHKGKVLYGQASYYASKFEGRRTANGEIFSHKKYTAACNSLPLGTWIEITNLRNGKTVIVKTNDRLHPSMNRVVDLTLAAARKLAFVSSGLTRVKVVVLNKYKQPK